MDSINLFDYCTACVIFCFMTLFPASVCLAEDQKLPPVHLIYEEPGIKVYEFGDKSPWGALRFPEKGGMIFKLDDEDLEIFFPEDKLHANIINNKEYLTNQPVTLLLVVQKNDKGETDNFLTFYTPDKVTQWMLDP